MSGPRRLLPLARRALADRDVDHALDCYLAESARAAEGFVKALERAYNHIRRAPHSGSPRWAHALDLPGLRAWPLKRYPYLVFYTVLPTRIEVWRVLHSRRDIPAWLAEGESDSPPSA